MMLPMHHQHLISSSSSSSKKPPLPAVVVKDDGGASSVVLVKVVGDPAVIAAQESAAVDVCLAAAAMAGAALLAWWAVAFHPSYAQLWMVPLGLVLACTPPVVCLALRFSTTSDGDYQSSRAPPGNKGSSVTASCTPLVAVVVDK